MVLRWLVNRERYVDQQYEIFMRHVVMDPESGERWIRAVPEGVLGLVPIDREDPQHRAVRSSFRRSFRSLERRGLVECRVMPSPVLQRDAEKFGVSYEIVRDALVARSTPAGRRLAAEIGDVNLS